MKTNDITLLKRFFHYLLPHKKLLWLSISAIPVSTTSSIILPWLLVQIIDEHLMKGNYAGFYTLTIIFGVAVFVGYIADSVYAFSLQKGGQLAIYQMRSDLFQHSLRLPRSYFDKKPIGVTLTRITSDMEAIGESFATGVLSLITDLIKTTGLLILLLYLNWKLTMVILVMFPPVFLVMSFLRKKLRQYSNLSRSALAESTGYLQECLNGIKTIQLYAAEKKVWENFRAKNFRFYNAQVKSNIYDASLFSVIEGITSVTLGFTIWYGANRILAGAITVGVLIGFINTLHKIFIPIREFTQHISVIQRALSALEHIEELLLHPEEEETRLASVAPDRKINGFEELCFEEVYFKYDDDPASPWIVKGLSFAIKKGERIALVGATGAGKSTIIKILTKAYTNYQGSIRLNGTELADIPKYELQQFISIMQQDTYLFDESLEFNIALGREGIGANEVRKAAEYVYADEFIQELPNQYDFAIKDNGKNLSSGQAQLIAFARAIAGNSEMIFLDEATSSVDSVTENLIQKAIEKILQEKTVIAIAHRLSTVQHSDLILVMQDGSITERGTHESLMHEKGYYAQLVKKLKTEPVP